MVINSRRMLAQKAKSPVISAKNNHSQTAHLDPPSSTSHDTQTWKPRAPLSPSRAKAGQLLPMLHTTGSRDSSQDRTSSQSKAHTNFEIRSDRGATIYEDEWNNHNGLARKSSAYKTSPVSHVVGLKSASFSGGGCKVPVTAGDARLTASSCSKNISRHQTTDDTYVVARPSSACKPSRSVSPMPMYFHTSEHKEVNIRSSSGLVGRVKSANPANRQPVPYTFP